MPENPSPRRCCAACAITLAAGDARAQSKNLAPGFQALSKNAKVVIIPTDIERYLSSASGIPVHNFGSLIKEYVPKNEMFDDYVAKTFKHPAHVGGIHPAPVVTEQGLRIVDQAMQQRQKAERTRSDT